MGIFNGNSEIMAPINNTQLIVLVVVGAMIIAVIYFIKSDLEIKSKLTKLQKIYDEITKQRDIAVDNINRSFEIISEHLETTVQPIEKDKIYYQEELEMYLGYISDLADANFIDSPELRHCAHETNKAKGILQKEAEVFVIECRDLFVGNSTIVGRIALELHKKKSIDNFHKMQELNEAKVKFSDDMTRKAQGAGLVSSALNE